MSLLLLFAGGAPAAPPAPPQPYTVAGAAPWHTRAQQRAALRDDEDAAAALIAYFASN